VAKAANVETACTQYVEFNPDVVKIDLSMLDIEGLETIRRLRTKNSEIKILVFSTHDSKVMVTRAFEASAAGYLLKVVLQNK
jgi:DNA-binding NarL/FixJ family response regulator